METVVSMAVVNASERSVRLLAATLHLDHYLKNRFPASRGFSYETKVQLAEWAQPLDKSALDKETRKRAYARWIRIKKGMNWGLTMEIQTTDREMSGIKVTAESVSALARFLGCSGFFLGMAAYRLAFRITGKELGLIGFAAGAAFGMLGGLIGVQFEDLKQDQVKEIFEASTEHLYQSFVTGY